MYSSYLSLTSPLITAPFPPPSPLYFFYLSLFLIFIRLSPVCLTRASFHFISFDDNLSFPIRLPRSPPLYPPGRSPSFSSPPPGSRLRRQCVVRHLTERQQKKGKMKCLGKTLAVLQCVDKGGRGGEKEEEEEEKKKSVCFVSKGHRQVWLS